MDAPVAILGPSGELATESKWPSRFKATLASWLGIPITLKDGDFWSAYFSAGPTYSEMSVNTTSALQLSAVWACVRLISETISTLPLNFYERKTDGTRRPATEHPLYEILHSQPNADMAAVTFFETVVASMLLWGNAFVEVIRAANQVIALLFLYPDRMNVRRLPEGTIEYRYNELNGRSRVIDEGALMHIPAFTIDGLLGLSPISYAKNVFGNAMAAEKAAGETFAKGMRASGFLNVKGSLTPDQRVALKKKLAEFRGHADPGGVFVTENDSTFTGLSMNPVDAELVLSRGFSVEEICRWFGLDPVMIGHGNKDSNWGTGLEQKMIWFLTFTLRKWCVRIEQAVRKSLLTPAERYRFFAEFAMEGLLRADSAGRAAFYSSAVQNGWMTRDEVRRLENEPPKGGNADVLTVQSNMLPIDKLGAQPADQTARSAFAAWLGLEQKESTT